VQPRQPLAWLDPGVFGTLGVGGGFAVAAKALRPNSEVWILFGDGSSAWSLSEVDTMVRHGLPCIVLIGNDAAWQQMHRDQVRLLQDPVASELLFTRYDIVGQGYGAAGFLVERECDVAATLREAKRVAREEKRPVVVNAFLVKSAFREGSISL
jgi:thiamine pyrophosphate-dependent acetolactate synthase large subunit-like protein